jgi:TrmH family RNA methyltransferase
VIRASEGYIFIEPVVKAGFAETVAWLKKYKIKSLAAATKARENYSVVNLKGPVAIVLGSEADGLSTKWLKVADKLLKIPMKKGTDSLNVSVAGAIIAFEALRQRGGL